MNTKENLLKVIKAAIKDLSSLNEKNIPGLIKKDTRGKLFAIEGMLRLHVKYPHHYLSKRDQKEVVKLFESIKKIEDGLGQISLSYELKEFALKKNLPKAVVVKCEKLISQDAKNFIKIFKKDDWIGVLTQSLKVIQSINWKKTDKKFILKAIQFETKKTDLKTHELESLVLANKYSYQVLEDGLHEWRRSIRWVSIYIQAYKHLFALSKISKKKYKKHKKLVDQYKDNKFAQLGNQDSPYKADAIQYYRLSSFIAKIGAIKSDGEMGYWLEKRTGYKNTFNQVEKLAHRIYQKFLSKKVLKNLIYD